MTLLNLFLAWIASSLVLGPLAGAFLAKGLTSDDDGTEGGDDR